MTARECTFISRLALAVAITVLLWILVSNCHGQGFLYSTGPTSATTSLGEFSGDAPWKELTIRSRGTPWSIEYRHLFVGRLQGSAELKEQTEIGGVKWEKGSLNQEVSYTTNRLGLSYRYPRNPISVGVGYQWLRGGQVLSGTDSEKKWREVDLTCRAGGPVIGFRLSSESLRAGSFPSWYGTAPIGMVGDVGFEFGTKSSRFSGGIRMMTAPICWSFGYLWTRIKINDISIRHNGPYAEVGVVW